MKYSFAMAILLFGMVITGPLMGHSEPLPGSIGQSTQWQSGWIDLSTMTDFKAGETLALSIGGTAKNIIVRLLSKGVAPDTPSGVDGGVVAVPEDRIVKIKLKEDHKNVIQISVHGGPNPWGLFPLGGGNGPATLQRVERSSGGSKKP